MSKESRSRRRGSDGDKLGGAAIVDADDQVYGTYAGPPDRRSQLYACKYRNTEQPAPWDIRRFGAI